MPLSLCTSSNFLVCSSAIPAYSSKVARNRRKLLPNGLSLFSPVNGAICASRRVLQSNSCLRRLSSARRARSASRARRASSSCGSRCSSGFSCPSGSSCSSFSSSSLPMAVVSCRGTVSALVPVFRIDRGLVASLRSAGVRLGVLITSCSSLRALLSMFTVSSRDLILFASLCRVLSRLTM